MTKTIKWLVWVVAEGTGRAGYTWISVHGSKDDADKAAKNGEIVIQADMVAERPRRLHAHKEGAKVL